MISDPLLDAAACERAAVYAYREGNFTRHAWLKRRAEELRRGARGHPPAEPPAESPAESAKDNYIDGDR